MAEPRLDLENLEQELGEHSARDFFNYARSGYLGTNKKDRNLESVLGKISQRLRVAPEQLWASQKFQLLFRATKPEHLKLLGLGQYAKEAEDAVNAGRVMSLLPYNLMMEDTTIKKFIPSRADKFSGNWRHSMDPYGIFRGMDRVIARDKEGNETYLATRKFSYAVLANIIEACHIGCDGCYKGSMVRTALSSLAEIYPEYAEIKKQLNLQEERAEKQAELLTKWLNQNPEVDTIVISGGEPTLFSNRALENILQQYAKAEHIKVVRMCTSSVFQGMWYRIDDEFTRILHDFEKETGKQFYINAHVTDDFQLSAPEARMAVKKLEGIGITIHLQMPLQEGINFQREDLAWSVEKLKRISKQAYCLGVIPYKMIVDMHSPSHPDLTVPLETVTKVIAFLDQHLEHSDHERWQAYNILHEQGNLYLTAYPHFTALKEIDAVNQKVIYFIPKVEFGDLKKICVHTYEEPLLPGHNDDPDSLARPCDDDILEKIDKVRVAYFALKERIRALEAGSLPLQQKMHNIEKLEYEFYTLSGIFYPVNEPLSV